LIRRKIGVWLQPMIVDQSSPPNRPKKSALKSRIANGSALLSNVDQRSAWCRRLKETLADHLAEIPDATPGQRAILRRAAVLEIESEFLESRFAQNGQATAQELDLYQRTASSLRRLLETIGLERRARDVTPTLDEYLSAKEAAE
jgi:hypothetical protein